MMCDKSVPSTRTDQYRLRSRAAFVTSRVPTSSFRNFLWKEHEVFPSFHYLHVPEDGSDRQMFPTNSDYGNPYAESPWDIAHSSLPIRHIDRVAQEGLIHWNSAPLCQHEVNLVNVKGVRFP